MSRLNISCDNDFITIHTIKNILEQETFYTQYEPFVSIKTGEIMAYEALGRFKHNGKLLRTDMVLEACHTDKKLFSDMEYRLKCHQFANRPDEKLFINFDVHSIMGKEEVNRFMELFNKQENFVIEIVENSFQKINVKKLIEIFKKFKFEFAVDDFFKEDSILSIFLLNHCDYLKLDKDILYQLKSNKYFSHIVKGLVKFVHSQNKKVILEGVETEDELNMAETLGIDMVQGFLYKDKFLQY